jgi:hypothetical protein
LFSWAFGVGICRVSARINSYELGDDQCGGADAWRYRAIISIIYLAAQIRNQNKESRRAGMNVLTTHWSDLNRSLV